jgi:uncharacterized protein (DUF697 family)
LIESAKKKLANEFFAIEKRDDLSDDEKVQHVIKISASVCAAVAIQPIPFADIFVLTPLQTLMGERIGSIRGFPISKKQSSDLIKEIAGVAGLGLLAQQLALGAYKVGLPGLAGFTTIPLVFGLTYAIGQVMNEYFKRKVKGEQLSKDEIKKHFDRARKQSKTFNAKSQAEEYSKTFNGSSEVTIRYLTTNLDTATLIALMVRENTDPDLSEAVLSAFQRYSGHTQTWAEIESHLEGMTEDQLAGVVNNVKGILHEMEFVRIENTDGDSITASYFEATNVSDWLDRHDGQIQITEELAKEMGLTSSGFSNEDLTSQVELVVDALLSADPTGNLWSHVPALSLLSVSIVVIELFKRYQKGEITKTEFKDYAVQATGIRITKIVVLTGLLSLPIINFPIAVTIVARMIFVSLQLIGKTGQEREITPDDLAKPLWKLPRGL